jgi:uncharacterized protein YecT (DUF1311 family)
MKPLQFLTAALVILFLPGHLPADPAPKEELKANEKDRKESAEADRKLNEAWAKATAGLDDERLKKLKKDQHDWLRYRDAMALSPLYLGTDADSEKKIRGLASHFAALSVLTAERTEWLSAWNAPLPAGGSVQGRWIDSYGGTLELAEPEGDETGQLHFRFRVVRGETFHDGEISGAASWNGRTGIFTDRGRADTDGEAIIVFVLRGTEMEVVASGTTAYHGMKAYFDGDYVRVGGLSKAGRKEVLEAATRKD